MLLPLLPRQQRQEFFRFHHPAIGLERGEKGFVNQFCRDDCIAILQVTRGAGIFGNNDLKTQVSRGAGGGIHAHVGHHAADDHSFDLPFLQHFE